MPIRKHYMTHLTPLDDPLRCMQLLQAAESVHNASKTFVMEETTGCARVKVQFEDDDTSIEIGKLNMKRGSKRCHNEVKASLIH
ncbi:hypothetical protein HanXRQr2_Chr02g0061261 [Helianthus annuus]|uniref:Uncharacterized protein n=1 Tax=Helianthus annuus TaxID=4232 RepID=A0A251VGJ0_HELAN|nr:hypothetical protein HanXRQr2_Chr02g0061261 [Helianthus annuus]KAJ0951464.1 hypothetical protein HanPSC8_Chr02g0060341 [Helianthus annuus]